jgi:hypothetical protein
LLAIPVLLLSSLVVFGSNPATTSLPPVGT